MNILLISPWFPVPAFGGALIRVLETLRYLARLHQVTLLAPVDRPTAEHVRMISELGVEVVTASVPAHATAAAARIARGLLRGRSLLQGLHYDDHLAHELRRLTALYDYDIVQFEHSFMAPYLASMHPDSRAKSVLSMHNVESLRFRREAQVAEWGFRRAALASDHAMFGGWEEQAVRRFDGIAAVSPVEQVWARTHAPAARVTLVPNGVNAEHFVSPPYPSDARTLVFSGLMNYPPNVDAVVWFCDDVLPIVARRYPDVRFAIVGDKPTRTVARLASRPGVAGVMAVGTET